MPGLTAPLLMIFLLGIDRPDFRPVTVLAGKNVPNRSERREHAVVHVIIAMLSVAADAVKIPDGIQVIGQFPDIGISVEIGRVGLGDFLNMKIKDWAAVGLKNLHFYQFRVEQMDDQCPVKFDKFPKLDLKMHLTCISSYISMMPIIGIWDYWHHDILHLNLIFAGIWQK